VRLVKKKFKEGRTLAELRDYISDKEPLSVRRQCELLDISRSGVYYQPVGESEENLKIMRHMDKHFLKHPTYGVIQMKDFLETKNILANEKRVRRLLRKMGVMAIYPGRNLSKLINAEPTLGN
jgi:putative transposase